MFEQETKRKVALVGTSRVGKTSIIDALKLKHQDNPEIGFIEEAARIYFTNNPEIPENLRFSFQHQAEIQKLQLELEKKAYAGKATRLLSDRSVLDAAVYVSAYGDKEGSRKLVSGVESWIPTYSSIVLLSPEGVAYVKDEIRREDAAVRQQNHEAYLDLFMREGIDYELLGGSLKERIQTVEGLLLQ